MLNNSAALLQTAWKERKSGSRFVCWNNIVMLCSLGLQSPKLPSREAKEIHLSQGSVLQSIGYFMVLARYDANHE